MVSERSVDPFKLSDLIGIEACFSDASPSCVFPLVLVENSCPSGSISDKFFVDPASFVFVTCSVVDISCLRKSREVSREAEL